MTSEQIDRVFGRGRLQMVTGAHVEVFREAAAPGEVRRYTKRFLTTEEGDYAHWTEREWRILARLIGHGTRCVPDVVQYDRGARGTKLVQTYDAGATVDQWATLLPVERDGHVHAHAFEDCAHWWALAHHCLVALDEIHTLQLVHLDVKGDNICIPIGPANFDPAADAQRMFPVFRKLALIDFAFSLVSGETLTTALPIGWQQDYDYQSPRLLQALEAGRAGDLQPTEDLDWRCDMYSLAAMLKRYLPREQHVCQSALMDGWTAERYDAARSLILRIREAHDRELSSRRPHAELIAQTSAQLCANELVQSLERGWTLARDAQPSAVPTLPLTPMTRLAPPIRLVVPPREDIVVTRTGIPVHHVRHATTSAAKVRSRLPLLAVAASVATLVGVVPFFADSDAAVKHASQFVVDGSRALGAALRGLWKPDGKDDPGLSAASATPQRTLPNEAAATTAQIDEAAGSGAAIAPGNDVASASAPALQQRVEAAQRAPAPAQAEPPPTAVAAPSSPPLSQSAQARGSSPAAPSQAVTSESLAAQIEAYRWKPTPRSTASARAPAPSTPSAGRASNAQSADSTRRAQLARTSKAPRAAPPGASLASRAPSPIASKKSGGGAVVASAQAPARTTSIPVVAHSPSAGEIAVKPPVAPIVEAKTVVAVPSRETTTVGASTAQLAATTSPPAQTIAAASVSSQPSADARVEARAPATSPAVTFPIAPPVETPRAIQVPAASVSAPGMAPIVEPPRTYIGSAIPVPRESSSVIVDSPRTRPPAVERRDDSEYLEQARRTLASVVPRTSAQAHAQIARVLWAAANAHHPAQERAVVDAASSGRLAIDEPPVAQEIALREARRLHEEARQAYWSRRHVPEAVDLELKAFGANPNDPEIAGNLANLYLQIVPAQPERARQLALHAIGMKNAQFPTGRADDWMTFAIASALTGRVADAKHALYASHALTRNLDRSCRTALTALATFGDRMREPVEALLHRLHTQGRFDDSPYCVWPANRMAIRGVREP